MVGFVCKEKEFDKWCRCINKSNSWIFLLHSGARTWATFVVILINYKLTPKRVPWGWLVTPWYVELIWFHRGQLHGGSANIRRGTLEALRRYLRTFLSPH